ncbi:hypothetical protein KEM56_007282 [Ascosphaera pollenicola]|nr:hypothetical protein KEM56_007282 [Ascosphaera pollenicola]
MAVDTAWRSHVGFADRLKNIQAIIAAYQTAHPDCEFSTAQLEATVIENKALEDGESKVSWASLISIAIFLLTRFQEDYSALCDRAINGLQQEATSLLQPNNPLSSSAEDFELPGDEDSECLIPPRTIGPYKKAYYHREGIFSVVYRARKGHNGELVALKVTSPNLMQPPHDSLREARILESIQHRNIVTLNKTFREAGGQFVLEFPFLRYQIDELWREKKLSAQQIKDCLRDLFAALEHIHAKGIIHRDIKPLNILLSSPEGPAYLTDFGIAWSPSDKASEKASEKITDVGTTAYRPPEILFGDQAYGTTLDMWAAGCVVAEAVTASHEQLFDAGPLGSELGLIKSIFTTLGTPNEEVWPSAKAVPDWGKMQFEEYPSKSWKGVLPGAANDACDLVSKLLQSTV